MNYFYKLDAGEYLAPILSLDPLLATVHLLAHWFCELNSGPIVLKKIAKLQGRYVEYEYVLSNIFTQLLLDGMQKSGAEGEDHSRQLQILPESPC
jgi:hypothetical protein